MLVSVVMTVYNGEEYLNEAILSILNQTYKNFEFIIINDGSSDKTKEILSTFNDSRVSVIHLENNMGAANALNIAIDKSKGSLIAIQDADDISVPDRLEKQVKYFKENPDSVAIGSKIKAIIGKDKIPPSKLRAFERNRNEIITRDQINSKLYYTSPLTHGSVMFSKTAYTAVHGYDTFYKIAYDYDLWMRLSRIGPIENLSEVLYYYRISPQSLSRQNFAKTNYESIHISTKYIIKHIFPNQKHFSFIVIGNKEKCFNFKKNIVKGKKIKLYCIYNKKWSTSNIMKLVNSIKEKKTNGIIVLSGLNSNRLINDLQQTGLQINKNLFHLWVK